MDTKILKELETAYSEELNLVAGDLVESTITFHVNFRGQKTKFGNRPESRNEPHFARFGGIGYLIKAERQTEKL